MIRLIIALSGSIFTAVQSILLLTGGQGICLNDGCSVVDSLTTVPPLYFNLAGFFFFQAVFWAIFWGRKGSEAMLRLVRTLLLAGLGAEAVLFFFQVAIARQFCSYCLIIFTAILLLNLLSGADQLFRGALVFCSVLIACFSLQFTRGNTEILPVEAGSLAQVAGPRNEGEIFLFFSRSCVHCEKVIESLRKENKCSISFNPVDDIKDFSFPGATIRGGLEYDPAVNVQFLKTLAIPGIPTLLVRQGQRQEILQGGGAVEEYLEENCREAVAAPSGFSSMNTQEQLYIPGITDNLPDGCSVNVECEDDVLLPQSGQE